jgi:hypothetical protein
MSSTIDFKDLTKWKKVEYIIDKYPDIASENQLRWLLRNRENNGFSQFTSRMGKTLLIHIDGLAEYLAQPEKRSA